MKRKNLIYMAIGVILAIVIFGIFYNTNQNSKEQYGKIACEGLGLVKNGFYIEYPPLIDLINNTEFKTGGKISSWSSKGRWIGCGGNNGCQMVDCSFPARLCFPSTYESSYCQNIELNLIINYQTWKDWKKQENGGSFNKQ